MSTACTADRSAPTWLSARGVARLWGTSPTPVRRALDQGLLTFWQIPGGQIRIAREDAERLFRESLRPARKRAAEQHP